MDVQTLDGLNSLLRDELAAIETYDEALWRWTSRSGRADLSQCRRSHEVRARLLRNKIATLGGVPATSAGLRGVWERTVEAGTPAVADDLTVRALEVGEAQILRDYRTGIPRLAPDVRPFVERNLLPGEEYTRRMLRHLVRSDAPNPRTTRD